MDGTIAGFLFIVLPFILFCIWIHFDGERRDKEFHDFRLKMDEGYAQVKVAEIRYALEKKDREEKSERKTETVYERVREGKRICIVKKEYFRCKYCGSKTETTDSNCTQCGAEYK
jgi:hypothetical protein